MSDFYINPLSINEQYHSIDEVLNSMNTMIECFVYMLPAISKGRVILIFDSIIENRKFISDQSFLASINNLPRKEKDLKQQWFLYTRNHAKEISSATVRTIVSSPRCLDQVEGDISNDEILQRAKWISFKGRPLNELIECNIQQDGLAVFTVKNVFHLDSLRMLLPRYEPNPKHRREKYFDPTRKEYVAPMSLNDEEAQRLLLTAIEVNKDRFAYHKTLKKFFRFKLTFPGKNIYHGFEIENHEIPDGLINSFE